MNTITLTTQEVFRYWDAAIEETSKHSRHDITCYKIVFLHDNGKYYRQEIFQSYNQGIILDMLKPAVEVHEVEKLVKVWEPV